MSEHHHTSAESEEPCPICKAEGFVGLEGCDHTLPERLRAKQLQKTRTEVAALFDIEQFTCDDCPRKHECQWAFDAYNTNGDCLADK
jgi:MoaA/NifB/PqqE/SkfB family radical SAM enzyme